MYLGRPPLIGAYQKLDNITSQFNSAQTVFTLTSSNATIVPGSPQNLLISLGGVLQEPGVAFTVSGSTVIFSTAPANTQPFFGVVLGDTLDVGQLSSGVDITVGNVVMQKVMTANGSVGTAGQALLSAGGGNNYFGTVGAGWEVANTINVATFAGNTTINVTGLSVYTDLRLVLRTVVTALNCDILLRVSTDGSTYLSNSGDYVGISGAGAESNLTSLAFGSGGATSHGGELLISSFNLSGGPKSSRSTFFSADSINLRIIPTTLPLVAIQFLLSAVTTFSSGTIYVIGRRG